MRRVLLATALTTAVAVFSTFAPVASADQNDDSIQLGPRPFYLVDGMDEGPLKHRLMQCKDGPFRRTDFSIGHRGAALQFPEHTKESYQAGARMGAGIVECDVTFTKHATSCAVTPRTTCTRRPIFY
jgi:glycerophosphoryl diester phosphodiesterase